jgi:hypothetical protein
MVGVDTGYNLLGRCLLCECEEAQLPSAIETPKRAKNDVIPLYDTLLKHPACIGHMHHLEGTGMPSNTAAHWTLAIVWGLL